MKPFRMIVPVALLTLGVYAQDNTATNTNIPPSAAQRARLLRPTNTFRGPTVQTAATNANAAAPAFPVPAAAAVPNVSAETTGPAPAAADASVPAAQVPTRTPSAVPALPVPTLPVPTVPTPGASAAAPANPAIDGAASSQGEVGTVLDLMNMDLDQVFEQYQESSGRTVLRPAVSLPAVKVTVRSATELTRKETVEALDSVLALNGIVMINMGTKFVKAVPAAQAEKEGAAIDTTKTADLPDAEQFFTKVVTLKTAKPSEVAQVISAFSKSASAVTPIDSNQTLVLRDYASNIKRMMELIEKIDVLPEKDFKLEVIPIRYGKVTDIFATMSALISGGGGGGGSGFTSTGVGGRSGGMGGFGGMGMMNRGGSRMGGMGNYGNYGSSYNRGGYGNYGNYGGNYGGSIYPQQVAQPSPAQQQNSFQNRLNQIVSKATKPEEQQVLENANIVPDERSNKLLIFANKRDMEMITNIVSKVDVLLAQVLIEAVILEVSMGDELRYGVSAAQRGKQFTPNFFGAGAMNNGNPLLSGVTNFPAASPEGFTYMGKLGSSFDVAVQAVAEDRKANVVSRPRIQTSHAIPGDIFVGETRPYVTGFSDYSFGTSLSTRSTVQEKIIGLTLSVTPFITPEGFVVMELQQQFDSYKGDIDVENNPYPLVDSRMASSMLTVRNGDLIMLGGFITDSRSKNKSGVPFLKDIPGLGALFRSTSQNSTRTELIILMKATVLETPEQAAFLAAQERATLPGIREAEMKQDEADAKRHRKVNKEAKKRSY